MLSKNLFSEIVKNVDFKLQCPFKKVSNRAECKFPADPHFISRENME